MLLHFFSIKNIEKVGKREGTHGRLEPPLYSMSASLICQGVQASIRYTVIDPAQYTLKWACVIQEVFSLKTKFVCMAWEYNNGHIRLFHYVRSLYVHFSIVQKNYILSVLKITQIFHLFRSFSQWTIIQ